MIKLPNGVVVTHFTHFTPTIANQIIFNPIAMSAAALVTWLIILTRYEPRLYGEQVATF